MVVAKSYTNWISIDTSQHENPFKLAEKKKKASIFERYKKQKGVDA